MRTHYCNWTVCRFINRRRKNHDISRISVTKQESKDRHSVALKVHKAANTSKTSMYQLLNSKKDCENLFRLNSVQFAGKSRASFREGLRAKNLPFAWFSR